MGVVAITGAVSRFGTDAELDSTTAFLASVLSGLPKKSSDLSIAVTVFCCVKDVAGTIAGVVGSVVVDF